MSDGTHIEWTDATWNIVTGCSVVSPGCKHCYAMKLAGTRLRHDPSRAGLTVETHVGPVWNGKVRFNEKWLDQPLRWKRPRKIFVCAHGDLFHESVPDEWIDKVFAVMALAPQHTFQVLTKRADRMHRYITHWPDGAGRIHHIARQAVRVFGQEGVGQAAWVWQLQKRWPLPNVWLGVSVEDQQRADERIPLLLKTPAAVRWLSCEPLLGRIDLCEHLGMWWNRTMGCFDGIGQQINRAPDGRSGIGWVVAGGESGRSARPMHPEWVRALRRQSEVAGVPFLFKQWGNWLGGDQPEAAIYAGTDESSHDWPDGTFSLHLTKKAAGRHLDGQQHDGYPA